MAGANLAFLHGAEVLQIDDGARPIRTVKSSVIGIVGSAGKGPVNVPTLIGGSRTEGVLKFGTWANDNFTIPEALDGIFDQGSAVVVAINVCDPAIHSTAVSAEKLTFAKNGRATLRHGYISDVAVATAIVAPVQNRGVPISLPVGATAVSVQVNGTAAAGGTYTYVSGTGALTFNAGIPVGTAGITVLYSTPLALNVDYAFDADSGTFTRAPTGKILPLATIAVDYDYVDASKVNTSAVLGGVDPVTGNYLGVHGLLGAKSVVHVQPRILCAPRFTHQKPSAFVANSVVAEMIGIADRLKAVVIADGPNTTDEDAITYRRDWDSKRLYIVDPWVKVDHPADASDEPIIQPASARVAGLISRMDNDYGFWWSPSNQTLNGIVGTARAVQFDQGDTNCRANYLNENEVTTIIRDDGFRLWGNRTASTDAKWAFLSVVRTADMVNESVLFGHRWAQDRPISKTLLVDIVEGVNAYLRQLKAVGAILGGVAWADPAFNTPAILAAGQVVISFDFTAPAPAERITFRSHLVDGYFKDVFA